MNRRHATLGLLALCGAVGPLCAAQAQRRGAPFRIAFLPDQNEVGRRRFVEAMKDHGWVQTSDFVIVKSSGLPFGFQNTESAARHVLGERPDLIMVATTAHALAAHRLTQTITIVMHASGDPVVVGLANSLRRPGKNVTGNTIYAGTGVWGKLVQLLSEAKPGIKRVGVLWAYSPPGVLREEIDPAQQEIRQASRALGLSAHIVEYASIDAVPAALAEIERERPDALILAGSRVLGEHYQRVLQLAEEKGRPTIIDFRPPTGARRPLLEYGASPGPLMRQAVSYVDRILKGAKPSDMPIQQPSKFELVVNLKTAKAIGLAIPQSLLVRADEVIE